ncbi:protein MIZU-KUSSEI 1 [Fagus crenata]
MSTSNLVKEMSSGLVRIALECDKVNNVVNVSTRKLFQEPTWTMYCNGRKCGYAVSRTCGEFDLHVLSTIQSVSVGAGVIPVVEDVKKSGGGGGSEGELLYMRARFERVVGSRDSEAFYMMNPDGNGGPELSIFLLRI